MAENIDPKGFEWGEYLEDKPIAKETSKPVDGGTYLFIRNGVRGIITVNHSNACDVYGRLRARNPAPREDGYDDWVVGVLEARFYRLQENDGSSLISAEELFTGSNIDASAQTARRPAPPARSRGKREVSIDGVLYVPYDSMADSDPFESYPYYRVKEADGSFSIDERPVALAVTTIGHCYECGSKQGPFGYTNRCYPCYERQENTKAVETRRCDVARGSQVRRAAPMATTFVQSHATAWGGVFNIGT